jgi:hypothetical protein
MLAKSSPMPTRRGYAFEPKLDGFRCLISTEGGFKAISRRRWDMTPLLPELERFPVPGVFDGELVAFTDGQPDFLALTDRMLLTRDLSIPVAFVVFDVLSLEGGNVMQRPYLKRRDLRGGTAPRRDLGAHETRAGRAGRGSVTAMSSRRSCQRRQILQQLSRVSNRTATRTRESCACD